MWDSFAWVCTIPSAPTSCRAEKWSNVCLSNIESAPKLLDIMREHTRSKELCQYRRSSILIGCSALIISATCKLRSWKSVIFNFDELILGSIEADVFEQNTRSQKVWSYLSRTERLSKAFSDLTHHHFDGKGSKSDTCLKGKTDNKSNGAKRRL